MSTFDPERYNDAVRYVEEHAAFVILDDGYSNLLFSYNTTQGQHHTVDFVFIDEVAEARRRLAIRLNPANESILNDQS